MSRTVILCLLDAAGSPLGALPPYQVPVPWWQEIGDVVAGARDRYRVEVAVLRLLRADRPAPPGGTVSYLAQVDRAPAVPLSPIDVDLSADPRRAPWAVPGGPAASLRWAHAELDRLRRGRHVAVPQRAWNLSAIWRLDSAGGPVWLKQVPGFFGHEPAVLRWLGASAPGLAPVLLSAGDGGRMLLDHVPGVDAYGLDAGGRDAVAADHHGMQTASVRRLDDLVSAGVPDRRGAALARTVRDRLTAHGADLTGVRALLDGLPARMAEVAACGVPDTLVHGDLHPGNVRIDGGRRVIIDWGDAFVGHPGFDILRLAEGLDPDEGGGLVRAWARRWRASVPGCDPDRAVDLLRPVAALRAAAVNADFLARIEPSEWPFHAADVPGRLALAARADG